MTCLALAGWSSGMGVASPLLSPPRTMPSPSSEARAAQPTPYGLQALARVIYVLARLEFRPPRVLRDVTPQTIELVGVSHQVVKAIGRPELPLHSKHLIEPHSRVALPGGTLFPHPFL